MQVDARADCTLIPYPYTYTIDHERDVNGQNKRLTPALTLSNAIIKLFSRDLGFDVAPSACHTRAVTPS